MRRRTTTSRVDSFVNDDTDLIGYVARLESMSDSGTLDEDVDVDDDVEDDDEDDIVGGELGMKPPRCRPVRSTVTS